MSGCVSRREKATSSQNRMFRAALAPISWLQAVCLFLSVLPKAESADHTTQIPVPAHFWCFLQGAGGKTGEASKTRGGHVPCLRASLVAGRAAAAPVSGETPGLLGQRVARGSAVAVISNCGGSKPDGLATVSQAQVTRSLLLQPTAPGTSSPLGNLFLPSVCKF